MKDTNGRSRDSKTVPRFLVDDANQSIEAMISGGTAEVDSRVQAGVNEAAGDIVNDFIRTLIDETIQEMLHEPIDEMEPEQRLQLMGVTLEAQAKVKLGRMAASDEILGSTDSDGVKVLQTSLKRAIHNVSSK